MKEINFGAKNLQAMATALIETFSEKQIELWDHPGLLADLRSLRVVERSFGYRLDAARNEAGHADRAIALCLALLAAREVKAGPRISVMDFGEPTAKELAEAMQDDEVPWELRPVEGDWD